MDKMNILVTLDSNYIFPLHIMLKSLFLNNLGESFNVYMIYSHVKDEEIVGLSRFCDKHNCRFIPVFVEEGMFSDAPVFRHYTKAMYYRLLAYELLPREIDKILYLDPDILIINPIRPLYETDISAYLYAGAIHTGITGISGHINRIRLQAYEAEGYYNSGVLLMNLASQRMEIQKEEIFSYVSKREKELILPDQDVLNALFGPRILPLDDSVFNYDARRYDTYRVISAGEKDISWVMQNTVILHFCGRSKPWERVYIHRFGIIYKHYMQMAKRETGIG